MPTYAIGDLQGCGQQLDALLRLIDKESPDAKLIFLGDLINRGPQSLQTLRRVRALGDRAEAVLGNHDLHLLAASHGIRRLHPSDTVNDILHAPDRDELLDWLRHRPLAILQDNHLMLHAGVVPQWHAAQTRALAKEVETVLQSDNWVDFLRNMYGNLPAQWHDDLQGYERLRCIVNVLTRLRFCTPDGVMDFTVKEGLDAAPEGLIPWFDAPNRGTEDTTILFGHWSTIGLMIRPNIISMDTGCVWGGQLSAIRLSDRALLQVQCPQAQQPG